jgi:hypothetical protein
MRKRISFKLSICSVILLASAVCTASGEPVKIMAGSPTFMNRLSPKRAEMEKIAGGPLDVKVAPIQVCVRAMVSGLVDGLSIGSTPQEAWKSAKENGVEVDSLDSYESFPLWIVTMKIALHPSNPSTELTKEQITAIVSGKVNNWETINGQKLPIKVLFAKNYVAASKSILEHYNAGKPSPVAVETMDKEGLLKALQAEKGAIAFFSSKEEKPDFKPKYFESEAGHPSYFLIKKTARPEVKKIAEFLRAYGK